MPRTLNPLRRFSNPHAELLAEHIRLRRLPWPARQLARRHGLRAATAGAIAELVGFSIDGGRP